MERRNLLINRASEQPYNREKLLGFLRDGKFVDCTFKIDGKEVKAHKLILACSSPVFEKMLFGDMATNEVVLGDIKLEVFNQMLDFIYTGNIVIMSVYDAWAIFYIANKYLLDELSEVCLEYISKNITMNSLLLSYEYSEFYNLEDLKKQCFHDIVDTVNAVFLSDYHMKSSTLQSILKEDLLISKIYLIYHIIEWAINECESSNLNTTPENIVHILKTEDILKYINKNSVLDICCEYCQDVVVMCQCMGEVIHETLAILSSEMIWDKQVEKEKYRRPPHLCKSRRVFKIARRLDLMKNEEFVSCVSVNMPILVSGLYLCTEMKITLTPFDEYDGLIVIRFCEENSIKDLIKPTIMKSAYPYNSQVFIPLRFPVILSPEKTYHIRISYKNLSSKLRSSIICSYMTNELVDKDRGYSTMYFYDVSGTIIKGAVFYPV